MENSYKLIELTDDNYKKIINIIDSKFENKVDVKTLVNQIFEYIFEKE
jgi:hypothetical protein